MKKTQLSLSLSLPKIVELLKNESVYIYAYVYTYISNILVITTLICIWTIDVTIKTNNDYSISFITALTNGFIVLSASRIYHIALYCLIACIILLGGIYEN